MKNIFFAQILILFVIGCDNNMKENDMRIIENLKKHDIQSLAIIRFNKIKDSEYFECPEEIDYFKKYIVPAMSLETDRRKDVFSPLRVRVVLENGLEYTFSLDGIHWQVITENVERDEKTGKTTRKDVGGGCYKLIKPKNFDTDLSERLRVVSHWLFPPRSNPPNLPDLLGTSKSKYEQYFQDITERSSLNKRRLAAFFQDLSKNPSHFWGITRRKDNKYFDSLGDFLLKKGDDITYDDLLKIIGAASSNSDAPAPVITLEGMYDDLKKKKKSERIKSVP
jgi:hypothetical protein